MTDLSDLKTIEVFDLEQLLSPYSVSEFLTSHWPEAFLYLEGNGKRLAAPLSIRELTDVENLARVCKRDVILWPPKNGNTSLHEHVADQSCPPNLALGFYDAGVTLYFTQVESYVLPIRQMLRSIENDLRLSPGTMECEIFASRKGSGTPVHFDHEINFNIQLKGKKRWTIAKNTSAPSPLTHFKIYDTPMGDLASYWEGPVLNEIPSNSRSFLAEEGSLVFLPQGYWHSTVCETDSLALSFVAKPPSWASIVIKLIRAELIKDERWRKRSMIQKNMLKQEETLRTMLNDLPRLVKERIGVQNLLQVGNNEMRYKLNKETNVEIVKRRKKWVLKINQRTQNSSEIDFIEIFLPLIQWVMAQKQAFSQSQALAHAGMVHREGVTKVVNVLLEQGVLVQIKDPSFHQS